MKLIYDMSSFIWRGLLAGKDPEAFTVEHEGKKVSVNGWGHGYENAMNMMLRAMADAKVQPIDCILVFEGMNSKARRRLIDPDYKSGRDSRPDAAYLEFQKVRDEIEKAWHAVGALCCSQAYVEGDDVLGWFADNLPGRIMIATFDGDMTVCNTEPGETNRNGGTVEVWIDGLVGVNKYGLFPFKAVSVYKALVGDGDEYKGCPGFGKGSWPKLLDLIGVDGLVELQDLMETGSFGPLHEQAEDHKFFRMLCDNEAQIMRCYRLAKLHPEWVHNNKDQIDFRPGIVLPATAQTDSRLVPYSQQKYLITADEYEQTMRWLPTMLGSSPFIAFDIETSSADESDDWLAAQGDPDGVDQMGSTLTGFSFTFGPNMNHTVYVSVDHAQTKNIKMSQARRLIETMTQADKPVAATVNRSLVVHNNHFELPVIYCAEDEDGTLWRDHWKDNGYHGFLPQCLDTKLEASYVNENVKLGLKMRSALHLGYKQTEYDEVTMLLGAKFPGGQHKGYKEVTLRPAVTAVEAETNEHGEKVGEKIVELEPAVVETREIRRYKMRELPATHVFDYGCDDTICTAGLHIFFQLIMQLEQTYEVYKDVEIAASYLHAKNFVDGVAFSLEKCKELERHDDSVFDAAWSVVRDYLISKGWEGVTPPVYTKDIKLAEIKQAFQIVTGDELDTMVRTPSKIVKLLQAEGEMVFSAMLQRCIGSEEGAAEFTAWVGSKFEGEPDFNSDSPKQMQDLLYTVMGLPIQIRNKPTDIMRSKGLPGTPKTDELAIKYALRVASPEIAKVLESLQLMKMVETRRKLYYASYVHFVHWKTGRIHSSHNQAATNTRRASSSKPNLQQMPKLAKIDGQAARFREVVVPHKPGAVVVSMDFAAQELRVIADYSQDPAMLACYIGDDKKDMHSLIGVGIVQKRNPDKREWTYETFMQHLKNDASPEHKFCKEMRALGKKVGFTTEYGAMAPKLAMTLLVSEEDAQEFIDAKENTFAVATAWKESIKDEAKAKGFVTTKLGVRRHLRDALQSEDRFEASKAERQAVNFKIQGSCAEMTKRAEGRMWEDNLFFDFDAVCYSAIHDEIVASVVVDDRFEEFLRRMHACMVAPYADMTVPIESSISFGLNFYEQIEIGNEPAKEAVEDGLRKLGLLTEEVVS